MASTKLLQDSITIDTPVQSFLHAYEQYFKHNRSCYADIFAKNRLEKSQETHNVCKFFFRVKWLGYDRNNLTWEPETTVPAACYLAEFKKLNNLPAPLVKLEVNLSFKSARQGYIAPIVLREVSKRCVKPTSHKMNRMAYSLNDEVDNGSFGMVPLNGFKRKMRQGVQYLKKGKEVYTIEENLIENSNKQCGINQVIEAHQRKDRTFLQIMIRHVNIVHMKDCFANCNENGAVQLTSVFEWCHQSLRQKVSKDKIVDWRKVGRDILAALAFIHTNGIHRGVSLDSVFYHSNGVYKLSDFNSFVFGDRISAKDVRCDAIELAPRKFCLSHSFDATVDIYALAIVLLQCRERRLFRIDPQTVAEMEEDIQNALNAMETVEARHFLTTMLRAREHIHNGLGSYRFSAASLMNHPVLDQNKFESVECMYIHDMLGYPINERVYYKSGETVEDVVTRHISLYKNTNKEVPQYLMVSIQDVIEPNSKVVAIDNNEDFSSVVMKDVTAQNSQLLIFPIISMANHVEKKDRKNYLLKYSQELGSCPIMLESVELTGIELAQVLKRKVITRAYRQFQIDVFSLKQEDESHMNKYTKDEYVMSVKVPSNSEITNRFQKLQEREKNGLNAEELEWCDVAGDRCDSLMRKEKKEEVKLSRKRAHDALLNQEVAKKKRKKTGMKYHKKRNENLPNAPVKQRSNLFLLKEVKSEPLDVENEPLEIVSHEICLADKSL